MSVDLNRLPVDEEVVRTMTSRLDISPRPVQNVLDALNFYRCRAAFAEQELTRLHVQLIAENSRIYGGSP